VRGASAAAWRGVAGGSAAAVFFGGVAPFAAGGVSRSVMPTLSGASASRPFHAASSL
jgi:hypothetical protein